MNEATRALLQIAKIALSAVDLELNPVPLPTPAPKPHVPIARKKSKPANAGSKSVPAPRMVCADCGRGFLLKGALLDATCPSCNSVHVAKRTQ